MLDNSVVAPILEVFVVLHALAGLVPHIIVVLIPVGIVLLEVVDRLVRVCCHLRWLLEIIDLLAVDRLFGSILGRFFLLGVLVRSCVIGGLAGFLILFIRLALVVPVAGVLLERIDNFLGAVDKLSPLGLLLSVGLGGLLRMVVNSDRLVIISEPALLDVILLHFTIDGAVLLDLLEFFEVAFLEHNSVLTVAGRFLLTLLLGFGFLFRLLLFL